MQLPFPIACIVSRPFEENTYVAYLEGSSDCIVIDPGLEPGKILDFLDREKLTPAAILNTHGHSDHIAGNEAMKERWPECPLVIGRLESAKLTDPQQNLSARFGLELISPKADRLLDEGDVFQAAGFDLEVYDIPGHSSGHQVYVWKGGSPHVVFGGDVLFAGGVGRTDFPDGSFEDLAEGIRGKLFILPDDTIVLPGHGPPTTIGHERETNPFVGQGAQ